jgi:uncharacterized membrane protein
MTSKHFAPTLLGLACLANAAQAHITYSGRDLGSFTGLDAASATIANQAVTGNFGWADAADFNLGDSHKGRAFRFHLDNEATLSLTVSAKADATASSIGGLLPGFSIYEGLAAIGPFTGVQTSADHDESDASLAWRTTWAQQNLGMAFDATATDGSWNATGDWKIGGDGDPVGDDSALTSFVLRGFSFDANKDGVATGTFQLAAGDYTLFVGGNDIANKFGADAGKAYGVSVELSTVTAVPEPATAALVATGVGLLLMARRKK